MNMLKCSLQLYFHCTVEVLENELFFKKVLLSFVNITILYTQTFGAWYRRVKVTSAIQTRPYQRICFILLGSYTRTVRI